MACRERVTEEVGLTYLNSGRPDPSGLQSGEGHEKGAGRKLRDRKGGEKGD